MSPWPPQRVDPLVLAKKGQPIVGRVELSSLARMVDLLADTGGEAAYGFSVTLDEKGRPRIEGGVEASLSLACQRCLQPLTHLVVTETRLIVVSGAQEAEQLGPDWEPLMLDDKRMDITRLVEEELILALPVVARHDVGECSAHPSVTTRKETETVPKENPFAVLAELKKRD